MHFSKICSVFIAMAGSVYSQDQIQPVTDLNDVRPGHIADMSALPYEIQSCIKLHVPLAWTDYPSQLDLFCDKSTGTWHREISTCISKAFPSSSSAAISAYNTFTSHLCSGWEAPGKLLTTLLTISGTPKVSTILTTRGKTRYVNQANSRFRTSTTSHACIWGKEYCRNEKVKHQTVYETESQSSRWVKSSHRKIATSEAWGVERGPASAVAMPTK